MQNSASQESKSKVTGARDRPWHLRAWSGITVSGWTRGLARHGFRVSPSRYPMAMMLSGMSVVNSVLGVAQSVRYGRRIEQTQLVDEPIFVIGHWRAGTTLLHELLVLDSAFTFPSTYACFSPNHFLISEWWLKRLVTLFLPRQRPMDNMEIGWDLPQEDEWALCNMGLPSPYLKVMFPNLPLRDREYQQLSRLSNAERRYWQTRFHWLLKSLTVRDPKPIVLKTPVHTFRVATLLELFPKAKFIHISRHPFDVFPSTVHTWKRMYRYHGLQVPKFLHLEEEVLQTFTEMYEAYEVDKQKLPPGQVYHLSYERLIANPVEQLEHIYQHFDFPITQSSRVAWNHYVERSRGYETNRYQLTAKQQSTIYARWRRYFETYGYSPGLVP